MRFKVFVSFAMFITTAMVKADEGGVSFWVPGFFGSLAASPLQPGFSLTDILYHSAVTAGPEVAFARQVAASHVKAKFSGNANIALDARLNSEFAVPSYTFFHSILHGQGTILLGVPYGKGRANVNATVSGSFGEGPGFTLGRSRSDKVTGFGDLAPLFNLRWNAGVHNYLTYITTNITVGVYNPNNLINLGINHPSIDSGAGYTYFDELKGREFSAVLGFTYNFLNQSTQYQNGIDMHMDVSASKFFHKKGQIGLVGYAYKQISCDRGAGVLVGCFKAQIFGLGPQIGYTLSGKNHQVHFNIKGFKEVSALHRAQGSNLWLTISVTPASTFNIA